MNEFLDDLELCVYVYMYMKEMLFEYFGDEIFVIEINGWVNVIILKGMVNFI